MGKKFENIDSITQKISIAPRRPLRNVFHQNIYIAYTWRTLVPKLFVLVSTRKNYQTKNYHNSGNGEFFIKAQPCMLGKGGLNVGKSFNPHFVFLSKTKLYSMIFLHVLLLFHVFSVLIYGYPRLKCMLILNFVTCLQQSPLSHSVVMLN